MNRQSLKILFIVISIFVFLILSIPTFTVNIAGQEININFSDRIAAKIGTSLGNFQKSFGIYPKKEINANLNFSQTNLSSDQKQELLLSYLNKVESRVSTSGLYDIKVKAQIESDAYNLVFSFPDYYSNPENYAKWFTDKAEFSFITADQKNPTSVDLKDYDIQGAVTIDYNDNYGSHLVFKISQDKVSTINSVFSANSQGPYFLMEIDGYPDFYIVKYDSNSTSNEDMLRAVPTQLVSVTNVREANDFLNVARSYFLTEPFSDTFTVQPNITTVKPIYKQDSGTFISVMFIISSLILAIYFLVKYKFKGLIKYILSTSIFILAYVSILKILTASISTSFLIGFVLMLFILNALIYYIYEHSSDEDELITSIRMIRDISIFTFIVIAISYKLIISIGTSADFIGALLIGLLVLFVMSILYFKNVFEIEIKNIKLPNLKKSKTNET